VSQPPPYNRSFSFSNFQAQTPTGVPPGSQIDGELNNIKAALDGVGTNLALIQRDDGALMNGSVSFDQLSPALQTAGLAPALPWVAGTAYSVNASVTQGSAFYRCLVAHTASVFATDLAAAKWVLIVDFSTIALVAASLIAVTPSGSLTTDVQTSLQALDSGKAATSHTHVSTAISDSTTPGRALLTAANVAAQQSLLGISTLGFVSGNIKETAGLNLEAGWYWCDGSNKNRVTDAPLFNAITIQQSGVTTAGSAVITGLTDTTNGGNTPMSPGMPLSGIGISAGALVLSVDSSTQVTMSAVATASGTTPLVFAPYGVGDGSTTFGIPNRAFVGVGRDNASGSASNVTQFAMAITLTAGSGVATVPTSQSLFLGMYVSHPKLPPGTVINQITGTSIGLSNVASASSSIINARFSSLLDAQTLGATGGTIVNTTTLVVGNLPTITSTNSGITLSNGGVGVFVNTATPAGGSAGLQGSTGSATTVLGATDVFSNVTVATQGISTSTGTTSTPVVKGTMQPTIVMNYIIKR
jgi:hypothetical protein